MVTILTETTAATADACEGDGLWLKEADVAGATGWTLKPEGFCKGDVCVPIPAEGADDYVYDGRVNVEAFWKLMNKPAVVSADADVWFLGEGADDRNAALLSLEAPDFTLPDFDGNMHSLTDFRGKRVLLATWASW